MSVTEVACVRACVRACMHTLATRWVRECCLHASVQAQCMYHVEFALRVQTIPTCF